MCFHKLHQQTTSTNQFSGTCSDWQTVIFLHLSVMVKAPWRKLSGANSTSQLPFHALKHNALISLFMQPSYVYTFLRGNLFRHGN